MKRCPFPRLLRRYTHATPLSSYPFSQPRHMERSFGTAKKLRSARFIKQANSRSGAIVETHDDGSSVPTNKWLEWLVRRQRNGKTLTEEEMKIYRTYRQFRKDPSRLNTNYKELIHLFQVADDKDRKSLSNLRRALEQMQYFQHAIKVEARVADLLMDDPLERARSLQRAAALSEQLRDYVEAIRWNHAAQAVCRDHFVKLAEESGPPEGISLYESGIAQCTDDVETIALLERLGDFLLQMGRAGEALTKYELALKRVEVFAKDVLEKQKVIPKHEHLVKDLGPTIVRLREVVKNTTLVLTNKTDETDEGNPII